MGFKCHSKFEVGRKIMKTAAVVLAAGKGKRMQSDVAKQYLMLCEKPVLYYALKAFEDSVVDEVVLVTSADEIEYCKKEIVEKYGFTKVAKIIAGGKERYHSVHQGICAISGADYVLIHDGARPFVTTDLIDKILKELQSHEAVVVGMPCKDTIKIVDEEHFVKNTPNRNLVWQVQTPQSFQYDLIKEAYEKLIAKEYELIEKNVNITDDAMVVEYFMGKSVKMLEGFYHNIKITTPEDLLIAKTFLEQK